MSSKRSVLRKCEPHEINQPDFNPKVTYCTHENKGIDYKEVKRLAAEMYEKAVAEKQTEG